LPGLGFSYTLSYKRGNKLYELTDPRGNMMATVTDRKTGTDENSDGLIEYYNADVVSAQDYYPFGALMPGRRSGEDGKYRYGYNGKENDNEVKGAGNQQDYGARVYDPRLGRFLSTDPLSKSFPWYSPYQFAGNMPIAAVDLDGEEQKIIINWHDANGKVTKTKLVRGDFNNVNKLYQSLSAGLNTQTTYDLEGTKFNATNAQFTQGFEAYKEGTMNPRGNHNKIRPNAGILKFDIAANPNGQPSVNISFDNVPIDKKDLTVQAMRGLSTITGVAGQGVEGLGYLAAVGPGTQAASLPLIGLGKGLGTAGDLFDIGADLLDGKYKDASIKTGFAVAGMAIGEGADKLPIKPLGQQAVDSYLGTTTGAVRDGYFDNRVLPVEESDELNLKIEQKK
jgi:RHS repeat-associated protein